MSEDIFNLIVKRLQQSAIPEEEFRLDQWIAESEENRSDYNQVVVLWYESSKISWLGKLARMTPKADDWERVQYHIRQKKSVVYRWSAVAVAAILIITFSFSILFNDQLELWMNYELAGNFDSSGSLKLEDGTTIHLYGDSKLFVHKEFGESERLVRLVGQGYFEVAKNSKIPFIVQTGEVRSKVVGTEFDLATMDEDVKISVTEGVVSFERTDDPRLKLVLRMNESAIYDDRTGKIEQTKFDHNSIAWFTKEFVFDNVPLEKVIKDISKAYEIKVTLVGINEQQLISTEFSKEDIESILEELSVIIGANVSGSRREFKLIKR